MVKGRIKWKQNVKHGSLKSHTVRSCAKAKENLFNNTEAYFLDAITDRGMIEIGHAWTNLIPFPLMKSVLSKHTHTQTSFVC